MIKPLARYIAGPFPVLKEEAFSYKYFLVVGFDRNVELR